MTSTAYEARTASAGSGRHDDLEAWAAGLGPVLAEHAARHDREGSWVEESYRHLTDAGVLALAVPEELGGRGATIAEVAMVMRILARSCGSTALAMAMHQHATAFTAWRYRHGQPGAGAALARIVSDGVVLATAGGSDFTHPGGVAVRVEGGYRVSGRKRFVSQSAAATVLSALFPVEDGDERAVISATIPFDTPGVRVLDTWDTLGMRGTASNDVAVEDVFVADDQVGPPRPFGRIDPPLQLIGMFAAPIISAVYLGIAEAAFHAAVEAAARRPHDPLTLRSIGLMATKLRVVSWALDGALGVVGDDPEPSMSAFAAVLAAKHHVATTGIEICDLAMDVAGGAAFYKGSIIERAYRDVRAAKFHPLTPELTLLHAGRLALGLPCDEP